MENMNQYVAPMCGELRLSDELPQGIMYGIVLYGCTVGLLWLAGNPLGF